MSDGGIDAFKECFFWICFEIAPDGALRSRHQKLKIYVACHCVCFNYLIVNRKIFMYSMGLEARPESAFILEGRLLAAVS